MRKARGRLGAYRETQALTPSEDFSYEGSRARSCHGAKCFYYQGIPADRQLPWEIAIKYTLDGASWGRRIFRRHRQAGHRLFRQAAGGGQGLRRTAMTVTLTLEGKRGS